MVSILKASSTTLKDLNLTDDGTQVNSSGVNHFEGIEFTNLRKVAISSGHLQSLLRIVNETFKLRILEMTHSHGNASTTQQTLDLLVRLSSHLEVVMIEVDDSSEEKEMRMVGNSNELVEFSKLEYLYLIGTSSYRFLKELLSNSRVLNLKTVDLDLKSDSLDEGQRLELESTLRSKSPNFKDLSVSSS